MILKTDSPPALELVAEVAARYEISALSGLLASARALARQDEISVAVLGRFKAGKSSFLNHFIGRSILPVGVVPVTAVVTEIRYGAREEARVHHRDGRDPEVPLDQIGAYISEKENPENAKTGRSDYRRTAGIAPLSRPEVRRYPRSRERAVPQHQNLVELAAECRARVGGGQRRPAAFAARHRPAEEPLPVHAESRGAAHQGRPRERTGAGGSGGVRARPACQELFRNASGLPLFHEARL